MRFLCLIFVLLLSFSCTDSSKGKGKLSFSSGSPSDIDDLIDPEVDESLEEKTEETISEDDSDEESNTEAEIELSDNTYYGRLVYFDGSTLYGGALSFKLQKYEQEKAFFTSVRLHKFFTLKEQLNSSDIIKSETSLIVPKTYIEHSNSIELVNEESRYYNANLHFEDNSYLPDLNNIGFILSKDQTTIIAGDNNSFFLIAQEGLPVADKMKLGIESKWNVLRFDVASNGDITKLSKNGVTIEAMKNKKNFTFELDEKWEDGENGLIGIYNKDAEIYYYSYHDEEDESHKKKNSQQNSKKDGFDGLFILSPNEKYILGIDLEETTFFGGQRAQ